jgi:hypothetical protein
MYTKSSTFIFSKKIINIYLRWEEGVSWNIDGPACEAHFHIDLVYFFFANQIDLG